MEYVYPFMDGLEPVFKRHKLNLSLSQKVNIAILHKRYYIADKGVTTEIRKLLSGAVALKFKKNKLYIENQVVEDPEFVHIFLTKTVNKIERLLYPYERDSNKLIAEAFCDNFTDASRDSITKELYNIYKESKDFSFESYIQFLTENIIDSKSSYVGYWQTTPKEMPSGAAKYTNIIEAVASISYIWTKILLLQTRAYLFLSVSKTSDSANLASHYNVTFEMSRRLNKLVKSQSSMDFYFVNFINWLIHKKGVIGQHDQLDDEELRKAITSAFKELLYWKFDDLMSYFKDYINERQIDNSLKKKLLEECNNLIVGEVKITDWTGKYKEIDELLDEYDTPMFTIVYATMRQTLTDRIQTETARERKIIMLSYLYSLEEQLGEYKTKRQEINSRTSPDKKRSKAHDLAMYGINYSLMAQYIYYVISGNVIAAKELGTSLKQNEGAAIYDILTALGFKGGPLSDEFPNEEKAKYQAIRPCFKLHSSGGYNIDHAIKEMLDDKGKA